MFHSLPGCDITTALLGVTKPTAFRKWLECEPATVLALFNLALSNLNLINIEESNDVAIAEKFVSSIYWQQANTLNEARRHLFLHKGTPLIKLPMISHTFQNKLRRSMFQASIWAQSLVTTQVLPDPVNWGYKSMENSNNLEFDWGTQPDVITAKKWVTLRKCNCNTDCTSNGRRGCHKDVEADTNQAPGCTTLCNCPCQD